MKFVIQYFLCDCKKHFIYVYIVFGWCFEQLNVHLSGKTLCILSDDHFLVWIIVLITDCKKREKKKLKTFTTSHESKIACNDDDNSSDHILWSFAFIAFVNNHIVCMNCSTSLYRDVFWRHNDLKKCIEFAVNKQTHAHLLLTIINKQR